MTPADARRADILAKLEQLSQQNDFDSWQELPGRYAVMATWRDAQGKWPRIVVSGMATRAEAEQRLCAALAAFGGGA